VNYIISIYNSLQAKWSSLWRVKDIEYKYNFTRDV
jgi:hypothetical protein